MRFKREQGTHGLLRNLENVSMIKLQLERAEQHASMTKRESAGDHEGPLMSSAEALVAGVQTADKKKDKEDLSQM